MPVPDQTSTLDAALSYAKRGWRVIPIAPGTKYPQGLGRWQDAATTDPETIRGWWTGKFAGYGVGIATGPESGIFVTDIDVSDGKRGDDSLRYLIDDHRGVWPDTVHDMTPTGGSHYFFKYPTDGREIRNEAGVRLGPGIDVRGIGGQVLAPPTLHPVTGTAYCWEDGFGPDEIEVAEPPEWLLRDLCDPLPAAAPQPAAATPLMVAEADGPARRFNEATTWDQLLTKDGWVLDHTDRDGEQHWVRPGKDPRHGTSATVLHEGRDTLKVFTDGVAFLEQEKAYSRFGYLACRDFGGDRSACAKWLRAQEDERQRAEDRAFLAPYPRAGLAPAPVNGSQANIELLEHVSTNGNGKLPPERKPIVKWGSDVEMRPVEWLWGERIAQGTLCLLAGREGIGKSTAVYDLAASITRGVLPGDQFGKKRRVLAVVSEDSLDRTVVPRLKAAGADLTMVGFITIETSEGVETQIDLPQDLWAFEDTIRDLDPALVILDPLMSRISGKLDSHKDAEVRLALEPIVAIAERTGTAIVGLIHVNKSGGTDPLNMVMGSRAFTAVARSVLFCALNPDDEAQRLLGLVKSNLGRLDVGTIRFGIETRKVAEFQGKDVTASKIAWQGETAQSMRDVLETASQDAETRDAVSTACEWLADFLRSHGGTYASQEIKAQGMKAGQSHSSLDRAKKRLGVLHKVVGKTTYWELRGASSDLRTLVGPASSASSGVASDAGTVTSVDPRHAQDIDATDAGDAGSDPQQDPRQSHWRLDVEAGGVGDAGKGENASPASRVTRQGPHARARASDAGTFAESYDPTKLF